MNTFILRSKHTQTDRQQKVITYNDGQWDTQTIDFFPVWSMFLVTFCV